MSASVDLTIRADVPLGIRCAGPVRAVLDARPDGVVRRIAYFQASATATSLRPDTRFTCPLRHGRLAHRDVCVVSAGHAGSGWKAGADCIGNRFVPVMPIVMRCVRPFRSDAVGRRAVSHRRSGRHRRSSERALRGAIRPPSCRSDSPRTPRRNRSSHRCDGRTTPRAALRSGLEGRRQC